MGPEGSLPRLQVPTTTPCPEPYQLRQRPHLTSLRSILILSFHLRLVFRVVSFPHISVITNYDMQPTARHLALAAAEH